MKNAKPFVKWAGGKRQLLNEIRVRMPASYERYFEPFLGGGAVLFELQPVQAFVNDINPALINTYKIIKYSPDELIKEINELDNQEINKEYYYKVRERYNLKLLAGEYDLELAALFIFLNKHCFNGLYRVNSKGLFNVPYNGKTTASISEENIREVSNYLQNVNIFNEDFEKICQNAKKGDFVFFDSPYAPLQANSFEDYTKEGFSQEEHIRLANLFKELTEKGCYCMLTNHNTEFIRNLYKDYNMEVVNVKRMINSDANNRVGKEIIIWNY